MQETRHLRKEINLQVAAERGKSSLWQRVVALGALVMFAFLLGSIPGWLSDREAARQRDAAQANLRLSQLQNRLALAAISSRKGEFESASVAASDFFTDLRAEIERRESGFSAEQLEAAQPILNERDQIITMLARKDKAVVERLTNLYVSYIRAIGFSPQS